MFCCNTQVKVVEKLQKVVMSLGGSPAAYPCNLMWKALNGHIFKTVRAFDLIAKLRARPYYQQLANTIYEYPETVAPYRAFSFCC